MLCLFHQLQHMFQGLLWNLSKQIVVSTWKEVLAERNFSLLNSSPHQRSCKTPNAWCMMWFHVPCVVPTEGCICKCDCWEHSKVYNFRADCLSSVDSNAYTMFFVVEGRLSGSTQSYLIRYSSVYERDKIVFTKSVCM